MNDADSKKLEEINERLDREYMGVTDSCGQDIEWLISRITEQDQEIERLQFQVKGLSVERTSAKQCAEKSEAKLAVINELLARREAIDDYEFAHEKIKHMLTTIHKSEADNRRLQEQVMELSEITLAWIETAHQLDPEIYGYEDAKKDVQALQHKKEE